MTDSIRRWQERYAAGDFDSPDKETQVEAGWADWWCDDDALRLKTVNFAKVLTRLKDGGKVDLDNMHSVFMNVKPLEDVPAYDSLRLFDAEGAVYICDVDDKRTDGKWKVYQRTAAGAEHVETCATVVKLAKWLNEPEPTPVTATFEMQAIFTLREVAEAVMKDSLEKSDVPVVIVGVQRKYFRDEGQALIWMNAQLEKTDVGTALAAIHGDVALIGYVVG